MLSTVKKESPPFEIRLFLGDLRNAGPIIIATYSKGSCYHLFLLLQRVFYYMSNDNNKVRAYYNNDHIITKINDKFYDITGEVDQGEYLPLTQCFSLSKLGEVIKELRDPKTGAFNDTLPEFNHSILNMKWLPDDKSADEWEK